MEKDGIAGVKLRPGRGRHRVPVHDARKAAASTRTGPTACRYYPVALLSMRKQDESTDRDSYALVKEDALPGPRRAARADHRRLPQGAGRSTEYDELARGWRQLILKKKSSGPTIGKPSKRSLQLFFMACYDVDRFRAFVASDGFGDALRPSRGRDARGSSATTSTLMLFAFRFLRQVLFGEATLTMRADVAQARLQRVRARAEAVEREAQSRRFGLDDDAYRALE